MFPGVWIVIIVRGVYDVACASFEFLLMRAVRKGRKKLGISDME